jgi:phage terminase large subunit-like protein
VNLAELVDLPDDIREQVIADLPEEDIEALLHDWRFLARPEQLAPEGSWQTWIYMAGRGAGKTRSGAEWVREKAKLGYGRGALIAPTAADARDVMIEGESGLLSVGWEHDVDHRGQLMGRPIYEPSKRRVKWANGAQVTAYSADEPERLRGPQHDFGWCDEMGAWKYAKDAWDMFLMGLRLGDNPQAMITTTPRPLPIIREILKAPGTVKTHGGTFSNRANLADQFVNKIITKFAGTRLGQQEIEGILLDDIAGALWTAEMVDEASRYFREGGGLPDLRRIVISVDPSGTAGDEDEGDAIGLIAAGVAEINGMDHGFVLQDGTIKASPDQWARRVKQMADRWGADCVVAERNYGGAMVEAVIKAAGIKCRYKEVVASRGKVVRAEPVAALYEQKRIHHMAMMGELEKQLMAFTNMGYLGDGSPDRGDALVWAITDLMITDNEYNFNTMEKAWS